MVPILTGLQAAFFPIIG